MSNLWTLIEQDWALAVALVHAHPLLWLPLWVFAIALADRLEPVVKLLFVGGFYVLVWIVMIIGDFATRLGKKA